MLQKQLLPALWLFSVWIRSSGRRGPIASLKRDLTDCDVLLAIDAIAATARTVLSLVLLVEVRDAC